MYAKPVRVEFIADPTGMISSETYETLTANLTKFNNSKTSQGLQCYLALFPRLPTENVEKIMTPREFARKLLREWFGKTDRIILIVLLSEQKRMEVALGSRAKRKLKDSHARRIARKVQSKLTDQPDYAAKLAVKEVLGAMAKDKGMLGSLRSMLMPVIIVLVLGCAACPPPGCRSARTLNARHARAHARRQVHVPVSYTHLTLPTICSV